MDLILRALLVGVGATALMDLSAVARRRWWGHRSLDYGLLGRWLGHLTRGTLRHAQISRAAPVIRERVIGWAAHYAIGITFAVPFLFLATEPQRPALWLALLVGMVTIVFPFFVMQPSFGMGVAASRTPAPAQARLGSALAHLSYGLGLWLAALLVGVLWP